MGYGGHTSCVALRADGDSQPDLILDAGTGIRDLDPMLTAPFDGAVLLSHLHWDHVQGLPFTPALLRSDARLRVVVPTETGQTALEALRPGFSPPSFPVPIDGLAPGWTFEVATSEATIGDWQVRNAPVRHKGGPTLGLRVERGGRSLAYLPDHDLAEPDPVAAVLAQGADVLLHDAQYLAREIEPVRHFGHSTIERAIRFAVDAGVRHLVLTHHAPARTDDELDRIAETFAGTVDGVLVSVARQGAVLQV